MAGAAIHQILPTIAFGDAVSNHAFFIQRILLEQGYRSEIYAENIDTKLKNSDVKSIKDYTSDNNNVIIHHFSIGSAVNDYVCGLSCKKRIMIYHNITPKEYFAGYSSIAFNLCKQGREQLVKCYAAYDLCMADSQFNTDELKSFNYKNLHTVPLFINFADYDKKENKVIIDKYKDGAVNIVFVGRVAPNKRQDDIIKVFYYYKNFINSNSRLFLVGSFDGMEKYYKELELLIRKLSLKDVYITGQVQFSDILAYFKIADVYLCMSEHEGFCVPLLEAMYFKVPVMAFASSAVPSTLGNAGVLINKKDYYKIAEMLDIVQKNVEFKKALIKNQSKRLLDFSSEKLKKMFLDCLINNGGV